MSTDVKGGMDYALLKRHYDLDDYVSLVDPVFGPLLNGIPFTVVPTFYVSGLAAYMNDATVANFLQGWTLYSHGQAAAPVWLAPILAAVGILWQPQVPAFEAKDTLFWSASPCWIRFDGPARVRHFIPANTFMRYHRRWFMLWVDRDVTQADGVLQVRIEG
jgi:hypothetical protein